jgi:hypothetical protein
VTASAAVAAAGVAGAALLLLTLVLQLMRLPLLLLALILAPLGMRRWRAGVGGIDSDSRTGGRPGDRARRDNRGTGYRDCGCSGTSARGRSDDDCDTRKRLQRRRERAL